MEIVVYLLLVLYSTYVVTSKQTNKQTQSPCMVAASVFYLELHVFYAVPVRKKKKKMTKGGIHCISRSSLGTFILCAGTHWSN